MIKFKLTGEHIKLANRMYVGWEDCEYGAPSIDCKRPYGNSSVEYDIFEILEWDREDEDELTDGEYLATESIHKEMQDVLQIVLQHLPNVELGWYGKEHVWDFNWNKLDI